MVVAKDAPHREARVNSRSEAAPDYYEVLQVSRNAHPLIVAKAYRLLAAFYHPDSPETGSKDHFLEVVEAYRVLSDPVRRAMYDRRLFGAPRAQRDESGGEALRSAGGPNRGVEDERALRGGLLQALYAIRRNDPGNPGLSLTTLAELLGCSIESMQFTLWYLRGKKLIDTVNDGHFAITVHGVDCIEGMAGPNGAGQEKLAMQPHRPIENSSERTSAYDGRPS